MKTSSIRKTQDKNFKFLILLSGSITLILFLIFSVLAYIDLFTSFDFNTTLKLQEIIPRTYDTPFSLFSLLGSFEVTAFILVFLLFLLNKARGVYVLCLFFLAIGIEVLGKTLIDHPGPPLFFLRYNFPFNFPSSAVDTGSSFPSGHSTRTAFIGVFALILILKSQKLSRNQRILMSFVILLIVLTMLVSRVYLGEHWVSDVMGGFLLGTGFSLVAGLFL